MKLNNLLMVETYLKKHRDIPIKVSELKKRLPKQVMHQTLIQILNNLLFMGKILIGTKGVQWIFTGRKKLNRLIEGGLEV